MNTRQQFRLTEKAFEIQQQSLPPNHPDLVTSYNHIGLVCEKMGNYSKALSFYERAVNNGQHSLRSAHSELQKWEKSLDRMKKKLLFVFAFFEKKNDILKEKMYFRRHMRARTEKLSSY